MFYKVYGISDCPSCLRACADLMDADLEYVFVNCDFSKLYRKQIREELNWSTFPIIILETGDKSLLIGGYDQLNNALNKQNSQLTNSYYVDNVFKKGDLVRWITGHSVYQADNDNLVGADPIYSYGIIIEVSKVDPGAIIVNSCIKTKTQRLIILNASEEDIDILSSGDNKNGQQTFQR